MDQLTFSFNEEISFQLKTTKWNFDSKPELPYEFKTTNMFATLDRSGKDQSNITPAKEKLLKVEY